ncbi:hypothetical protein PMAYCL1PPCAC_19186, partial [Pristionchus mayeri]
TLFPVLLSSVAVVAHCYSKTMRRRLPSTAVTGTTERSDGDSNRPLAVQSPAKALKRSSASLPPLGAAERSIERDCVRVAEQFFDSRILAVFDMFRRRTPLPYNVFNTFSFKLQRSYSAPARMIRNASGRMSRRSMLDRQPSVDQEGAIAFVFIFNALAVTLCTAAVIGAALFTGHDETIEYLRRIFHP